MSVCDLLGRDYIFTDGYTYRGRLTIVAWCPERGYRLAGRGYSTEWIQRVMFRRLLRAGVLEVA